MAKINFSKPSYSDFTITITTKEDLRSGPTSRHAKLEDGYVYIVINEIVLDPKSDGNQLAFWGLFLLLLTS